MTAIVRATAGDWALAGVDAGERDRMLAALEAGGVLQLEGPRLPVQPEWLAVLDPSLAKPAAKNIRYDAKSRALKGALGDARQRGAMAALLASYQDHAVQLVRALAPAYQGALRIAPASLRLFQAAGRPASWRKDDSRLHIDAFPSRPNRGERILRVFHNLNPGETERVWRVGEPFAQAARRFCGRFPRYSPLGARALASVGATKGVRSEYDHLMLNLHDAMKADAQWQATSPQQTVAFPPGSTWVCFSDQVAHAAVSGQFLLEQTLHLPVAAMREPERSPLRVLESLYGRALA